MAGRGRWVLSESFAPLGERSRIFPPSRGRHFWLRVFSYKNLYVFNDFPVFILTRLTSLHHLSRTCFKSDTRFGYVSVQSDMRADARVVAIELASASSVKGAPAFMSVSDVCNACESLILQSSDANDRSRDWSKVVLRMGCRLEFRERSVPN